MIVFGERNRSPIFFKRGDRMDIILLETGKLRFSDVSGYLGCVTRARRERVERKKNDSDKLNCLLSELLVLSEITARTGIPQRKIAFDHGSYGKPYLRGSDLQFSLSHTAPRGDLSRSNTLSQGAICAAFSTGEEIGIDIESKSRGVSEGLKKRVLCDEEQLHVVSGEDVIRMWVKKEAFLKRLGVGITRDLRTVNTLTLPETEALDAGEYFVGASGKGAREAVIRRISAEELLARFVKLN